MGLYGPPPLDQLVDAMGSFCPVRGLGCQTYCFKRDGSLGKATTSSGGFGPVDFRRDPQGAAEANVGRPFLPQEGNEGAGESSKGAKEVYRDEFVSISAVVLAPEGSEKDSFERGVGGEVRAREDGWWEDEFAESSAKRFRLEGGASVSPSPSPSPRTPHSGASSPSPGGDAKLSVVYVCELPDVPGKFDPVKAKARGLKPGREYARLVKGESVTAPNGLLIKPSDVMEPTTPGPVFALVDCPTAEYLPALVKAQGLARFRTGAEDWKQVRMFSIQ
jgi:hypothetical protein